MKRYSLQLLLLLCVGLLSACISESMDSQETPSKVKEGDDIPSFTLHASDGQEVSSTALDGQVYVLTFFDTGCPDCQQELQVLQRIYDKFHSVIPVLNIPRSQSKDEVQAYWSKAGLTMPFHIPDNLELYYQFATRTIPRTYIIDEKGKVCATFTDSPIADFDTLEAILQEKITEADSRRGSVNLSMKFRVPAMGGSMDEYYFRNEYVVTRLDVYFYNAATKKFFTKVVIKDLSDAESTYNTQYDITYIFENFRLRGGIYDVFAIANYDYSPDKVENEDDFLNMIDSVSYKEGIEANIPDNGAVMTSRATALIAVNLIPWIDKTYALNIDMERVMAKLQIGVAQNSFQLTHEGKKYADINITNYKLVNLNRQYYLFQHKDSLPTFTAQPTFTLNEHFTEYKEEGQQYVVDPFFYQKTTNTADVNKPHDYYKYWYGDFNTDNFASMPSANNYGYAYILENTSFKTYQKNGYSPGIIFKAAVNPVFVYLYDPVLRQLKEENRPEYWPQTIYLYQNNFYGSIQAINSASGMTLDELAAYTDNQLKTYGIKQCKFNMGVYETYYAYWIQHRIGISDEMEPMEYGIIRNNFYKIHIVGISGIGHSSIVPEIMRDNYPNSYADVIVDH